MAFDITPYIDKSPAEVRGLIRQGVIDLPGLCPGQSGDPPSGVRRRL